MPKRVDLPEAFSGGPFHVAAAQRAGVTEKRLRSKTLSRPFHGVRSITESNELVERCRAFVPRMREAEVFSHVTAAALWNCPLPAELVERMPLHVAIPAPSGESRVRGVVGHKIKHRKVEVRHRYGLRVTDPVTTFIHSATLLKLDDLVAIGDHLILTPQKQLDSDPRPYTTSDALIGRIAQYHGPGKRRCTQALALMRQGAESRTETLLRLLISRGGLPEPSLNVNLFGRRGEWIARVDMLYPKERLVVEYDGQQHRTDDALYESDATRHANIRRAGYTEILVRKHGLFVAPETTLAQIREALALHTDHDIRPKRPVLGRLS